MQSGQWRKLVIVILFVYGISNTILYLYFNVSFYRSQNGICAYQPGKPSTVSYLPSFKWRYIVPKSEVNGFEVRWWVLIRENQGGWQENRGDPEQQIGKWRRKGTVGGEHAGKIQSQVVQLRQKGYDRWQVICCSTGVYTRELLGEGGGRQKSGVHLFRDVQHPKRPQ